MFELIDVHPWLGSQLMPAPWQAAVLPVFEVAGERQAIAGLPAAAIPRT